MKDIRYVAFVLAPRDARRMLLETGIPAQVDERDGLAHCAVKLMADDPVLNELLSRLEALGETALVRAHRIWSEQELDACDRLLVRVATAGLGGGIGFGQPYDRSRACATCGAGAVAVPPLHADLPRMGRKHVDETAHDGLHVVSAALANAIQEDGLVGVAIEPVRSRSARYPADRHRWLMVTSELPPCRADSSVKREDVCPACGRSGHYDAYGHSTELRYDTFWPRTRRTSLARGSTGVTGKGRRRTHASAARSESLCLSGTEYVRPDRRASRRVRARGRCRCLTRRRRARRAGEPP
jgi:hypothetical protein